MIRFLIASLLNLEKLIKMLCASDFLLPMTNLGWFQSFYPEQSILFVLKKLLRTKSSFFSYRRIFASQKFSATPKNKFLFLYIGNFLAFGTRFFKSDISEPILGHFGILWLLGFPDIFVPEVITRKNFETSLKSKIAQN